MMFAPPDLISFWCSAWSRPLRGACEWFTSDTQPLSAPRMTIPAPRWLRPLCVQRWVGQAVAARLAWLREHPDAGAAYRFDRESEPCWLEVAWASYDRRCLRALGEETILWLFGVEVERLLRILEEPPDLVGNGDWTKAALGVSEHVAQVYAELKRRHKAMRARALLREELQRFVAWEG